MAFCSSCMVGFFGHPLKAGIFFGSLLISILIFFLILRTTDSRRRVSLIYLHLFTLIFPFLFFLFYRGCEAILSSCNALPKLSMLIGLSILISVIAALLLAPFLYVRQQAKKSIPLHGTALHDKLTELAISHNLPCPELSAIPDSKPYAYSTSFPRQKIVMSVGLMDMMTEKEQEAVLLHEFAHIRQRSSEQKFSAYLLRVFSPLAWFIHRDIGVGQEEQVADDFAVEQQGTDSYLKQAKQKIEGFETESRK